MKVQYTVCLFEVVSCTFNTYTYRNKVPYEKKKKKKGREKKTAKVYLPRCNEYVPIFMYEPMRHDNNTLFILIYFAVSCKLQRPSSNNVYTLIIAVKIRIPT